MEIKITKRQKLLEINNDMCHNYYYLVNGRIYNDDKTAYRKFKFIPWFDIIDVDEYFNYDDEHDTWLENPVTQSMIDEYLEECIWAYVSIITEYAEHLGISVEELEILSDYLGIDCGVWED